VQTRAGLAIKRVLQGSLGLAIMLALATAAVASAQDTVAMSDNASFGTILTDANGMTLYTWQGDQAGVSNCSDQCANAWPPLLSTGGVNAPAGLTGALATTERADGTWVVTLNDWPLYRFVRDTAPGDTNGQGVNAFGAVWSVAVVERAAAAPLPAVVTQPMGAAVPAPVVSAPAVAGVQAQPATATATSTPMPTATPTTGRTIDLTMVDFDFMPRNIRIAIGDSVRWTNRGRAPHTATSNNQTMGFDSDRVAPGESWTSPAFTTAGTVNYVCQVHPNMRGSITVSAVSSGTGSESAMRGGESSRSGMGWNDSPMGSGFSSRYGRYIPRGGPYDSYAVEPYNSYRWGYAGYPFYSYYQYPNSGPTSYYGYPYYAGYSPSFGYGYPFLGSSYGYGIGGYPGYGGYSAFSLGGTYPYISNGLSGYGYGYPGYGFGYGFPGYGYGFGYAYPGYGYPFILMDEQDTVTEDPGILLTAASASLAGGAALAASLNPTSEVGPMQFYTPNIVEVQILDNSFLPLAVTIPVGGSVRFTNFGNGPHSATSDITVAGQAGQFDSGVLQRGQTFTTPAFNTAGNYAYHDTINTALRGTINVIDATAGNLGYPYYGYGYGGYGYGGYGYPYTYSQGSYYPYTGFYGSAPYGYFDPLYGPNVYGNSYTYYPYGSGAGYGYNAGYGYGVGYPYGAGYGYSSLYGYGANYGYPYNYGPYSSPGYGYPQPYGPYYWTQLY